MGLLLFVTMLTIGPAASADDVSALAERAGQVSAVVVDDTGITINGRVDAAWQTDAAVLHVYELATYETPEAIEGREPVTSTPGSSDGAFAMTVGRFDGQRDRYHSKFFMVAEVDGVSTAVDDPRYVTEVAFEPTRDYPYPEPSSKKGLQVEMPGVSMAGDAEELGVDHATVNFTLDGLFYEEPVAAEDMIVYEFDGREYYFRRSHVESYDAQISSLSDNGMLVYLILLLYNQNIPNSPVDKLIHPDAALGEGTVYAFNASNAEGVGYLRAAFSFIAERYTRPDEKYGRALGFIVGNEVDSQWIWSNMGEQTMQNFVANYERTVRLAWQAARIHYGELRVYISLTHYWNMRHANDPLRYYTGRDVIEEMNRLSKQGGDYPWHIAHHPYPQNLTNPRTWEDTTALDNFDTPRVTFKNLHILPEYLRQDHLLVDGAPRRVVLSEQGFNTPDLSEESQQVQAAAYAYAYYKAHHLPEIDAFILHRHVDHQQEGGLRLGLWMWDPNRSEPSAPGEPKYIYNVFRDIDTTRSLEVTEFAKPVIGIDDWSEVVPNWNPSTLAVRTPPTVVGARWTDGPVIARAVEPERWEPAENVSAAAVGEEAVTARFSSLANVWKGVQARWAEPIDASATPYFTTNLRLAGGSPVGTAEVKVKVYSGRRVAEAGAYLDPAADSQQVGVDLRNWAGRNAIDRIKIWVRADSNATWSAATEVSAAGFTRAVPPATGDQRNLGIHARTYDLAPGSRIRIEVVNHDLRALAETLTIDTPAYLQLASTQLAVDLPPGGRATYEVVIERYDEAAANPTTYLEIERPGQIVRAPVQLFVDPLIIGPPPGALPPGGELRYDFEGEVSGWGPGQNIASVASEPSFLNGPGTPYHGDYVLVGRSDAVPADVWRTVRAEFAGAEAPDFSSADEFFYFVNSYGGVPNATYETSLVIETATDRLEVTNPYGADGWNLIRADLSELTGREAVTAIEIGYRAVGSQIAWSSNFQLDAVGVVTRWQPE